MSKDHDLEYQNKLVEAFDINPALLPAIQDYDEQFRAFRALLIARIEELASKNMEQLMWVLYRIDVNEKKLKAELQNHPQDEFATVMADAIIQRQLEKAETRKKFSDGESGDWRFDV